jgi:hypothetical protein
MQSEEEKGQETLLSLHRRRLVNFPKPPFELKLSHLFPPYDHPISSVIASRSSISLSRPLPIAPPTTVPSKAVPAPLPADIIPAPAHNVFWVSPSPPWLDADPAIMEEDECLLMGEVGELGSAEEAGGSGDGDGDA